MSAHIIQRLEQTYDSQGEPESTLGKSWCGLSMVNQSVIAYSPDGVNTCAACNVAFIKGLFDLMAKEAAHRKAMNDAEAAQREAEMNGAADAVRALEAENKEKLKKMELEQQPNRKVEAEW